MPLKHSLEFESCGLHDNVASEMVHRGFHDAFEKVVAVSSFETVKAVFVVGCHACVRHALMVFFERIGNIELAKG